jgi:hypothetical protein
LPGSLPWTRRLVCSSSLALPADQPSSCRHWHISPHRLRASPARCCILCLAKDASEPYRMQLDTLVGSFDLCQPISGPVQPLGLWTLHIPKTPHRSTTTHPNSPILFYSAVASLVADLIPSLVSILTPAWQWFHPICAPLPSVNSQLDRPFALPATLLATLTVSLPCDTGSVPLCYVNLTVPPNIQQAYAFQLCPSMLDLAHSPRNH